MYFGKYEGIVKNNRDPEGLGRLQVRVPSVLGTNEHNWARPCVPYAGKNLGFYMIPPNDANVWIEFMNGNLNYPIWSGCFWKRGDLEPNVQPTSLFIKTKTTKLVIEEKTGEESFIITFQEASKKPVTLKIDANAIQLEQNDSKIMISTTNVDLITSHASIQLGQNDLELTQGVNNTIKLSNTGINLNNGALEVI